MFGLPPAESRKLWRAGRTFNVKPLGLSGGTCAS